MTQIQLPNPNGDKLQLKSSLFPIEKTSHSKKDRNSIGLTEAEDIKKRWQQYTEGLYKKYLNDPDNHDGVITHLEPDILGVWSKVGPRKDRYEQS